MFETLDNLKIISIIQKANRPTVEIKNRAHHALFIRVKGDMLYDFGDKSIVAKEGNLIFIPKGASYTATRVAEQAYYTAIHFDADFQNEPSPLFVSLDDFAEAGYAKSHLADAWNFGNAADKLRCTAVFYQLLSHICSSEFDKSNKGSKYKIIAPAIEHLKEHIYDKSLKCEKLHRLCGISNTYFRKIFESRYGATPQSYVNSKRLSHAMSIISEGDYTTIAEVAEAVGFNDPLYFSKAFKRSYGISPSDVNNY